MVIIMRKGNELSGRYVEFWIISTTALRGILNMSNTWFDRTWCSHGDERPKCGHLNYRKDQGDAPQQCSWSLKMRELTGNCIDGVLLDS
jgi:hypothetical protein